MNDQRNDEFEDRLHDVLAGQPEIGPVPTFEATIAAAEKRLRRRRLYVAGGYAAAGMAMIALVTTVLLSLHEELPGASGAPLVQIADIMETTQWRAPSDALLPSHEIDIYSELPELIESTGPAEGALL